MAKGTSSKPFKPLRVPTSSFWKMTKRCVDVRLLWQLLRNLRSDWLLDMMSECALCARMSIIDDVIFNLFSESKIEQLILV